ncbi:hypothetical protein ACXPWS_00590 [Mycobacterium sp. BMJ-28]
MPDTDWDDDDEIYSPGENSGISAFDMFIPDEHSYGDMESWPLPESSGEDNDVLTVTFSASNPTETVVVTALMDGKILKVDLAPQVVVMTETELSQEIVLLANLARMQAQAAQHALIAAMMHRAGLDPAATRSFIERDLHLPSPATARKRRAEILADRYLVDE